MKEKNMIKEKILEILYQLGFQQELVDENFGYRFEYEGLTVLSTPEDEDAESLLNYAPQAVVTAKKRFIRQYEAVMDEDKLIHELSE